MAGTITISSSNITSPSGQKQIGPLLISAANPIGQISDIAVTGAAPTTVAVPSGASAAVITPPASNVIALLLKGVGGDTGVSLSGGQPSCISLAAATTSFVLELASSGTITVEVSFI